MDDQREVPIGFAAEPLRSSGQARVRPLSIGGT